MSIILKFPSNSNNDIFNYADLFLDYNKTSEFTDSDILIDCEDISFIKPLGINLLSAIIFNYSIHENKVKIKVPKNASVNKYLSDQGFFEEFNIQRDYIHSTPRSTSVALKRLDELDGTYLENISNWLSYNGGISLRIAQDLISISLLEAINNVFDHSESPIGCYISAQAYHKQDMLILSVLDFGMGLLASLKPFYTDLENDTEAISRAVLEGISSKRTKEKRLRGVGLTNISGFLRHRGAMEIISYYGEWFQTSKGYIKTKTLSCPLKGTCVNLYIYKRNVLDIVDSDEEVWGD